MSRTCSAISLGCLRNTYDSEIALRRLTAQGYTLLTAGARVDTLIVNTCGFIKDARNESIAHIRRCVSLKRQGKIKKLVVMGADTLSGEKIRVDADLVVLATAIQATKGVESLAQKLGVSYDEYNFLSEAHPKLRPVETASAGVFLAGACQAARDIPDAVAQASGAASLSCAQLAKRGG